MSTSTLTRGRSAGVVRLYAGTMLVVTGMTVLAALLVVRSAPTYSSSAELLVGPTITSSGNYIQPSMPTEQRIATSAEVISRASKELGVTDADPLGDVEVTVPVDTQVLVMTYTADTPAEALRGAEVFASTYLQIRNPRNGDPVASLVSPPVLPADPVSPNYPVVLGVAVVGGLLVGFAAARAWDRVRGRIRSVDDARHSTGLDVLTVTPRLPERSALALLSTGVPPLDPLAARLLSEVEDGPRSTVLVTSASPRHGSTPVATLTAASLARMGRVVLLVTADRDVVPATTGPGDEDVWPAVRATGQEGLHIVSVAEWDASGASAARLACLLPELHDQLPEALIVVDGPTAWSCAGLSLRADRVLLVVTPGECSRSSAATAVQSLDHCRERLMGLVVTPRPRRLRQRLEAVRVWVPSRARMMLFRFGPVSGGLATVTPAGRDSGTSVMS